MTPPAQRTTLVDDVYESIKGQLMDLVIEPGARVNIEALARDLAVSPTPVREALARLESDGLVRKRAMSGYTATPLLTADQFEQLCQLRALLEVPAARLAAGHPDAAARAALATAVTPPSAEIDPSNYRRYAPFTAHDAAFHDRLARLSGNPMLADSIVRLHAHLHLHRLYLPAGPTTDTVAEHRAVAAAIAGGRPDVAATAMAEHLSATRARHIVAFSITETGKE
ncbi:GntR family transcriptional regulator [Actinocatenispora thailandica]|uniref:GntR family transcriptional regulator n=1 Tax=Actinocatenispora thailandica TaxID=227318 RepID=A0A7R7HW94_9ACTN|nr:GntR family transcriptional regulator [Actinocatenispora thailandica]BCJ34506.1 GntR family transcriptional regulator [Actinocatenispora thailandica]